MKVAFRVCEEMQVLRDWLTKNNIIWLLTDDRLFDNDLRFWCYNWIKDEIQKSNKN